MKLYLGHSGNAAWVAATRIALRDRPKEAAGGRSIYKVLVKVEFHTVKHPFTKGFLLVPRI